MTDAPTEEPAAAPAGNPFSKARISLKQAFTKVQVAKALGTEFTDANDMADPDRKIFGLPIFQECRPEFLRLVLRELRLFEMEVHGISTWLDENEQIFNVSNLPADAPPPFLQKVVGQVFNLDDYLCSYDDYGIDLIVVISGKVEKIIAGTVLKVLGPGDVEGITEFLGWTTRRKSTLRIAEEGSRVRFLSRDLLWKVLDKTHQIVKAPPTPEEEEGEGEGEEEEGGADEEENEEDPELAALRREVEGEPEEEEDEEPVIEYEDVFTWDYEREMFNNMVPDQVDAIPPEEVLAMSFWGPLDSDAREAFQSQCLEQRYYLPGQYILRSHTDADCAVIFLRGSGAFEEEEPPTTGEEASSWLFEGYVTKMNDRRGSRKRSTKIVRQANAFCATKSERGAIVNQLTGSDGFSKQETVMSGLDTGDFPGEEFIEVVSGSVVGACALIGGQVRLDGLVKARTPVLVAIVWKHIFNDFINGTSEAYIKRKVAIERARTSVFQSNDSLSHEARFFTPSSVDAALTSIRKRYELEEKMKQKGGNKRPPSEASPKRSMSSSKKKGGQPGRSMIGELMEQRSPRAVMDDSGLPLAGTADGFLAQSSPFKGHSAYDALRLVLLNSFQNHNLLNEILGNAPQQLLEALISAFVPQWLVPGQVLVEDETDVCSLFVFLHGEFTVHVAGADVAELAQGAVQGEAQILNLMQWTRTIRASERNRSEGLVMVLTRESFNYEMKGTREDAKFPVPTKRLAEIETRLAKEVPDPGEDGLGDGWLTLQQVPMFKSCSKKFIKRLYKDADLTFLCPGEAVALEGEVAASMVVVVAGRLRSEKHKTLYCVEYGRGPGLSNWCFQNNFLGNDFHRCFDLVAVTHTIIIFVYRHTLLQCLVEFPRFRPIISGMQTWMGNAAPMANHRTFEGCSPELMQALVAAAEPRACASNQCILPADMPSTESGFFFVQRGHAKVVLCGETTQELFEGDGCGTLQLFGADVSSSPAINSVTPCDGLYLPRRAFDEILSEERFENEKARFDEICNPLIEAPEPDETIKKASVFDGCSERFINLVSPLVEDRLYWPGDALFNQGEEGQTMYIVHVGAARLEMSGVGVVGNLGPGACTGEQTALGIEPARTVTARATQVTWARILRRSLLQKAKRWFPVDGDIMVENSSGKKMGAGSQGLSSDE